MHEFERSFEQEPTYTFPWQQDAEGHYLRFRTDEGTFEARDTNTLMYLFPDMPEADHVWIQIDGEKGMRLFREHVDRIGEGAFSALCDQMFERGFDVADDEEPQECDLEAFYENFGRLPERIVSTDRQADQLIKGYDIDAAWRYYSEEWSA